ncbi:putative aminopeptidase-2 [Choristoneura fumiferana]|uniref:putative aminopeptidase-2 n=1 Tax=Choristoneura fumiferana TaxID=7141 RepID=UPI003D15CF20
MAALKLLVLALACYCASSFPQDQPKQRNTIFGDEKLQGEIFENLKDMVAFDDTVDPALYRLPTTTKPIHYNILWGVDFTSTPQAFSGTVEIQLQATQAGVSEIVIQSEELTIGTVSLLQGTTNIPVTYELEPDFQFMRINLTTGTLNYNAQTPVVYSLTISFAAPLRNDMYGIYRSWFRNQHNDTISWMATTQFQATSARKAFPCYDEPSFKATFDITISRPAAYYSWSCTRIASTVPTPNTPNYENDIYHRTPIMSTYLLALIVAEYDSLPILNEQGQLIYEVIARPNAISTGQGQYALEVGQDLLAEMNNHTDYNFYNMNPELKMTQASIPDFSAGAMENWGLLTYREAYIMYDPVHTNGYFKQLIAYILSHEIAHMWFGNLVTNDWWDVLWLNEGFARYYQYFLTHWVETDMGLETRFITEQVHTALLSDSANNPYPLTNPGVGSPSAVSAMFSTLSYNKGAAVIRMTEHLLGHEVHRQGLRDYLVKHQFETVLPIDLFESLEAAGVEAGALAEYGPNFSLIDYYKSWTEQRGHPVLEVQVNHQTGDMTIHQRRFNINSGYSAVATNWIIPITFSSASNLDFDNTKPTHVISKAITVINRGSIGDEWVIFNKQQTGYYRVNYDDYTWDLITAALRGPARTQIHEYNRAQIVNDVFQFARAGIMSYTKALNILSFLEFETSYAPWVAAMTGFTWLRNRLTGTQFLVPLETLISQWATVVMRDLTYYPRVNPENPEEPEDFMRSYLRYQLAPVMCQINRDNCRAEAVTQFNALRDQDEEVPADSRNWVYCNALREGTIQEFNFLRTRFLEHNVYTEKILLLQILGCTRDSNALSQFLTDIVAENEIVRPQDYTVAFNSAVTGNEENTQIVFSWIQNNFALVNNAFNNIATPLSYISSRLRNEAEVTNFLQWVNANAALLGDAYDSVVQGAESARASIQWTATILEDVSDYLDNGFQEIELSTAAPVTPEVPPVSRWVSLFLGLALVQGILTASPIPTADEEWESFATMLSDPAYRLPTTTRPRHYVVSLTPYFETAPAGLTPFSFTGDVTIYMQPTTWFANQIVLHCNDLTIQSLTVSYTDTSGVTHEIAAPNQEFTCVMPYSFLYIQTTEMMWASQEYVIRASFTGNLQENMRGFYRSWYVDSTGNKRWMATTQFQPGHARQAFPCYDEPGFKATFDITMNREANFSETIGNMPIRVSTPLENGRIADVFYTTPYTSTYLLAFIVSHYIRVETNGNTVRPFDIYARDNVGTTGQWALEIGEQLLEKMEEYTDFPYYSMAENLNMKQAAIPDFSAGAMENWGLLTYREALILYDPLNSNHFYKQRVANIVAHEIAHMWIGNLVTCAWWDNLWLNEGFARFYQYFLTEMVRPDLGYSTRFIIEQVHVSMISDSIDSAHALTNPAVTDPVSVSNHFSTITYARGASVVRMTQFLLGVDTFVKGLRAYLKERAFNVAEPIHLFTAFDEAAAEDGALAAYNGITIEEYFKTWSEQPGHPLLHVEINHRTGEMIVTQSRWERNTGQSSLPSLYHVPITWTRAGDIDFDDLKPTQILTAQSTSINRGTEGLEWVIFNKQESGFYRVNYDNTNWAMITQALMSNQRTAIHEFNRAQIVDDALQLARAGVLRYERAFNIISFLRNEDQYAPWLAAITGFNWVIRRLAHDDDNLVKLRTVINDLSIAATTRLGFAEIADESYMDGLMRMYLNTFLCNNGHAQCVTAAITNFNNWLNGVFIPANMRPWVYCTGLRLGSAANFDTFWDRYLAEDLASEKVVMLEAAGCTNNQASLEKYLTAIVSGDDSVRSQDFTAALNSAVSGNEANTMRAFYWLRNNVAQTIETLGSASTLISYITARLLNEQQIAEVQAWLDAERAVIGESAYNTGVAGIASTRNFLAWADVRTVELSTFFETGYIEEEIVLPELEPEPEPEPELQPEPEPAPTPSPDSANIAALSAATLLVTLAFNMMA